MSSSTKGFIEEEEKLTQLLVGAARRDEARRDAVQEVLLRRAVAW